MAAEIGMMPPQERWETVVVRLLDAMTETVTNYHPQVKRTSTVVDGLIQGTACFPGGSGLWRGENNGGPNPEFFPLNPVMFVAHNFDSERGYQHSLARQGEGQGEFWQRLLRIVSGAGLSPQECFFTNALMGLKPGKAEGAMPSVPGYQDQCQRYLSRQVEIVRPRAVVALGAQSARYVSRLHCRSISLRHPGAWCFRPLATRESLLAEEGRTLRDFLGLAGHMSSQAQMPATVGQQAAILLANEGRENLNMKRKAVTSSPSGTDEYGFRIGTRQAFLMRAVEAGGKTRDEIRLEFLAQFPNSDKTSTFDVFFSDLVRPFGSASASRCLRIEYDEGGRLSLDPERAKQVKAVIKAGILKEINALEGTFPKKDSRAIDEIVWKYRAPHK